MIKSACWSILFISFFLSCKPSHKKYHITQQQLTNNAIYGWGNIFDGGKIKIINLSDTGFEFQLKPYTYDYNDTFAFPPIWVYFMSDSIAESKKESGIRFIIHILNPQSITIDQSGQPYFLPWRSNEHVFIMGYELSDNLPSLPFLNKKLNYSIKRKIDKRINDFIECLKDCKTKIIKDSTFTFTNYWGTKATSGDTTTATILVRNDLFYIAAISIKTNCLCIFQRSGLWKTW
jgi:hypothetical protein